MQNNDLKEKADETMEITNRLLLEMLRNQKSANKNLFKVFLYTIIGYTLILISMIVGFFIYESQFEIIDSEHSTYEYQQEVSGDGSDINNIQGDQYNDSSTHNEN